MLLSKTYKFAWRKELRVPFSNADLQRNLLSVAKIVIDQISLVGGYHKFMSIGVTAQELAMVCFATCVFPGHPLGNICSLRSPDPLPRSPRSPGKPAALAGGAVIPGSWAFPRCVTSADYQHAFRQGTCWGSGSCYTFTREEKISAGIQASLPIWNHSLFVLH